MIEREIPLVDDGVRDVKDNSYEDLKAFYRRCHIGEYLKITEKGKFLKFNFGAMLDAYRTVDEEFGEAEKDGDERVSRRDSIIKLLSYIEINKKSFTHNMNTSARYINYFIEYFDEDDELMNIYFQLMFAMMYSGVDMDVTSFTEMIMASFTSPTMLDKIIRMVEYNTDTSLIKTPDRKYNESIQLTVEHLKAIMGVSCLHKFVIPIISQYYNVRKDEIKSEGMTERQLYFYVFSGFFKVFDEHYDISLYNKLYHTATTRISKTENGDATMWKRRQRLGTTTTAFTHKLMSDFIIDISQKVVFCQSAIIFIHVCFDRAITTELMQKDTFEFSEMRLEASDSVNGTVSKSDIWATDNTFHSQRDRLRGMVSIADIIYNGGCRYGLDFSLLDAKMDRLSKADRKRAKAIREEYKYYQATLPQPPNDTQMYIIYLYISAALQSPEDAKQLDLKDLPKIIMIMKRDFNLRNYNYLQFFVSSEVVTSSGRACHKKHVEKLFTNNPNYEEWEKEYTDTMELLNMDRIYGNLRTILSCPIKVVDFTYDKLNGETLIPNDVAVVDEFLRFMVDL